MSGDHVVVKRLQVWKAEDGWRWRSLAGNGEVIASGEAYVSRFDAVEAAKASAPANTPLEFVS